MESFMVSKKPLVSSYPHRWAIGTESLQRADGSFQGHEDAGKAERAAVGWGTHTGGKDRSESSGDREMDSPTSN